MEVIVLAYLSAPIIVEALQKEDFCRTVIQSIEKRGIEVFAPQFLDPASAKDIYTRDVEKVRLADFLIAEVSSPSLGVGMEIMLAIELVKPILMFMHRRSGPLSKMVSGAPCKVLFMYDAMEDVVEILTSRYLENLIVQKCPVCASEVAEVLDEEVRCIACQFSGLETVV